MQKATPVRPPVETEVIEVDMTSVHFVIGALSATTIGLAGATAFLWRKVRKNDEYLEAIREYVARLVNSTECGEAAYQSLVDEIEAEENEPPVNWAEEPEMNPYPRRIRRRIREHSE